MTLLLIKILIGFAIGLLLGYLFRVFGRPKLGPPLEVAKVKTIEIEKTKVSYLQEGRGPHLVLIHGLGASVFCWRFIFQPLTKYFRVTAIDLPGFGSSDKNIFLDYSLDAQTMRLKTILDKLEIDSAYLVGSSMGGALALWLAKLYPGRVKGIVGISPAAHCKIIAVNLARFEFLARTLGRAFVRPYLISKLTRRVVTKGELVSSRVVEQYYRPYHNDDKAVATFWKAQQAIRDPRLPSELNAINTPVLVLHGQRDRVIKEKYIREIGATIPNSVLKLHAEGGHHLMEDEPDFVLTNILDFFGVDSSDDKNFTLVKS